MLGQHYTTSRDQMGKLFSANLKLCIFLRHVFFFQKEGNEDMNFVLNNIEAKKKKEMTHFYS